MAKGKRIIDKKQPLVHFKVIILKYRSIILVGIILAALTTCGTIFVLDKIIVEPACKVRGKIEDSLGFVKKVDPQTATKEQVQSIIAEGEQIKEWTVNMKEERGYIIPLIVSVLLALIPLSLKAGKKTSTPFFVCLLLSFSLPLVLTSVILSSITYFTVGSTFDIVNDMYDECQNLMVIFEERAATIKDEESRDAKQPSSSINTESHESESTVEPKEPEPPKPYALNLNDPYWNEYFDNTSDVLNSVEFLVKCLELSYVSYPNPQNEKPFGYNDKIVDALEDEDTYYNYFVPNNKYIKPEQDDRFVFLGRAIDCRLIGDGLYGPKDDLSHEWYAPSKNRKEVSNNYDARGLDYYHLRNEWITALGDWEEAIRWQCRTLRSLITEDSTDSDKQDACNRIIHIYQKEIGALEGKSGIDDEMIARTKIIVDVYTAFKDEMGW